MKSICAIVIAVFCNCIRRFAKRAITISLLVFAFTQTPNVARPKDFWVTTAEATGPGSLYQAARDVWEAVDQPGPHVIKFSVGKGPVTISPICTVILSINGGRSVVLDGTTQPGYTGSPIVELDGSLMSGCSDLIDSGDFFRTGAGVTIRGLVLNRSPGAAIRLSTDNNVVENCFVGTDITGTIALGNGTGIHISDGRYNRIGGVTPQARNLISGNAVGIAIERLGSCSQCINDTSSNYVIGNLIGTDATGRHRLGNEDGILVVGAAKNRIGGLEPGERNVISGNLNDGIRISWRSAIQNVIQGNFIGVDATGTNRLGNGRIGVLITHPGNPAAGASSNLIGGLVPEAGNVISGNGAGVIGGGVRIVESNTAANLVLGNLIGTDATGKQAIPNVLSGVFVRSAPNNTIASNVISGNPVGVTITESNAMQNVVIGNRIGVDITGTNALPNTGPGIVVDNNASHNLIGGTNASWRNIVAFNGTEGVQVGSGTNNTIIGNSIFSNFGLGIDLGNDGVTLNDADDSDSGANYLINHPMLTSATSSDNNTTIAGTINGQSRSIFRLEFFSSDFCDPSGFGEGKSLLGFTSVTTDGDGKAAFVVNLSADVSLGHFVTASATDAAGNSSEFSRCVAVSTLTAPPAIRGLKFSGQGLEIVALPGGSGIHHLEATANVRPTIVWTTLTNWPAGLSPLYYFDAEAALFPQRFYRVVTP